MSQLRDGKATATDGDDDNDDSVEVVSYPSVSASALENEATSSSSAIRGASSASTSSSTTPSANAKKQELDTKGVYQKQWVPSKQNTLFTCLLCKATLWNVGNAIEHSKNHHFDHEEHSKLVKEYKARRGEKTDTRTQQKINFQPISKISSSTEVVHENIRNLIVAEKLPFKIIESHFFKEVINSAVALGAKTSFTTLDLPSRKRLRNDVASSTTSHRLSTEALFKEKVRCDGLTLCADAKQAIGGTSREIVYGLSPKGKPLLIKAFYQDGHSKDTAHYSDVLFPGALQAVPDDCAKHVTAIVTDGCAATQAGRNRFERNTGILSLLDVTHGTCTVARRVMKVSPFLSGVSNNMHRVALFCNNNDFMKSFLGRRGDHPFAADDPSITIPRSINTRFFSSRGMSSVDPRTAPTLLRISYWAK